MVNLFSRFLLHRQRNANSPAVIIDKNVTSSLRAWLKIYMFMFIKLSKSLEWYENAKVWEWMSEWESERVRLLTNNSFENRKTTLMLWSLVIKWLQLILKLLCDTLNRVYDVCWVRTGCRRRRRSRCCCNIRCSRFKCNCLIVIINFRHLIARQPMRINWMW